MFDAVVVIPVYNHGVPAVRMVKAVRQLGLPCILVDDGSEAQCAAMLAIAAVQPGVRLLRLHANQGKGGAVMAGLRAALQQGHTHAVQIDADGQHDARDIPAFLDLARTHPGAVICGNPVYDASVPRSRLIARYATHVWVWINTLSLDIRDSMCGFRVYPLAPVVSLIDSVHIGQRMDFDTEVLVRLHWRGVAVFNRPTRVTYPRDGVSHFRLWRDNVLISRMHARLFFGMVLRLPWLLWRRVRPA
ncbi:glycosyltransferase family 2 protein [Piscinibacter sp.]|jgi:glycosyltransferase involved in cell wall biosynthesis|uniref:glycosyltransferase family 2 protein n=1 Tax=Piscinibacter sp. TaxID=1903157 RepID=UPI003559B3B8